MEMLCPECRGELVSRDGKYATCTLHGGRYEILFSRFIAGPAPTAAAPATSKEHPPAPLAPAAQQGPPPDAISVKCPHCAAGYRVSAAHVGKNATCKKCGLKFQINPSAPALAADSFGKATSVVSSAGIPSQTFKCARHPALTAEFVCARCGARVCKTCVFAGPDGTYLCPGCIVKGTQAKTSDDLEQIRKLWRETPDQWLKKAATEDINGYAPPVARIIKEEAVKRGLISPETLSEAPPAVSVIQPGVVYAQPPPVTPGQMCLWHPAVAAVQTCKACGSPVCQTCDFIFPGNIHVCPRCATASPQGLSGKRRKYMIASYALAAFSTCSTVFFLSGAAAAMIGPTELEAIGIMMSLFMLVPAIIGTAMGTAAMERHSKPMSVWIAAVWNGLIVALFILLSIAGLFMG